VLHVRRRIVVRWEKCGGCIGYLNGHPQCQFCAGKGRTKVRA